MPDSSFWLITAFKVLFTFINQYEMKLVPLEVPSGVEVFREVAALERDWFTCGKLSSLSLLAWKGPLHPPLPPPHQPQPQPQPQPDRKSVV